MNSERLQILLILGMVGTASCALLDRAGKRIADGDEALTIVTTQRAVDKELRPVLQAYKALAYRMDNFSGDLHDIKIDSRALKSAFKNFQSEVNKYLLKKNRKYEEIMRLIKNLQYRITILEQKLKRSKK